MFLDCSEIVGYDSSDGEDGDRIMLRQPHHSMHAAPTAPGENGIDSNARKNGSNIPSGGVQ